VRAGPKDSFGAAKVQRQGLISYFWMVAGFLSLVGIANVAGIYFFEKLPVTSNIVTINKYGSSKNYLGR
jgi:hypothetical protein